MSLPADWTQVPVTGTFVFRNGDPLAGKRITFESDQVVTIGDEVIVPKRLTCTLDDNGAVPADFTLPSTNDPDLNVTGWAYTVKEKWPGGREFDIFVPYDSAGIDLATVSPAVAPDALTGIETAAMATAVYTAATAAKDAAEASATTATEQATIATTKAGEASASADAAAAGAASASASATAADTSADLAEAARLLGATIGYATKADMDADLAHDAQTLALVTNDPTTANNGTYRKDGASGAGSWVLSADRVTALEGDVAEVKSVVDPASSSATKLFEFKDNLRRLVAYIDDLGTLAIHRVLVRAGLRVGLDGREVADDPDPDTYFAVRDKSRRTYFSVGKGGARAAKLTATAIDTKTINGTPASGLQRILTVGTIAQDETEREVVASYGQSLSIGTGASDGVDGLTPIAITVDQPYGNLMFPKGPRFWDGGQDLTTLVPHIEQVTVSGGETILGGFQSMLAQLYSRYGMPHDDRKLRTIAIAPGLGEQAIAQLRQGTGLFTRYMQAVQAAVTLNPGKVVKSRSMFWLQGESDGTNVNYVSELIAMAGEVDTNIRSATGQSESVITFTYQMPRGKGMYETSEAAKQSPLVKVAAPIYWAEYNGQAGENYDNTHLSAKGYAMVGACFAVAWFSEFALRIPWRPLSLAKDARGRLLCRLEGSDLIVKYHVPFDGGLVFDDTVRPKPNHGIYLFASDGVTQKPIADLLIENRNELRLVGVSPAAGDIIRIGFTSPTSAAKGDGTNLRDNMGEFITFDDHDAVPIHNWAIGEQHTLTVQEIS